MKKIFKDYQDTSLITKGLLFIASIILAMLVGSLLLVAAGANPIDAYYYMLIRPLSSFKSLGEVSIYFVPLLLVAIGVSFTFHCKLSNLGGEGQILFGALGMTLVGVSPLGEKYGFLSLILGTLVGIIFGGLWAMIAAFFKSIFNASEIVITLMLNYVAVQAISYIIFYHLKTGAEPQSARIAYGLPRLVSGSRMNVGIIIALILVVVYALIMNKTSFGYNLKVLGGSIKAANYSGINIKKYYFIALVISGLFTGLAGAFQISGNTMRLMDGVAADFGFGGIVVALLGGLHPIGIVLAAFFMALIQAGAVTMQVKTGIPTSFANVIEALIVLFVLLGMALHSMLEKRKKAK